MLVAASDGHEQPHKTPSVNPDESEAGEASDAVAPDTTDNERNEAPKPAKNKDAGEEFNPSAGKSRTTVKNF